MKAVLQRVLQAKVTVNQVTVSEIGHGLLVYLGVAKGDTEADFKTIAEKILKLRIFPDQNERMQFSVSDNHGEILLVSQFTLCANTRDGNRPDFFEAMEPAEAQKIYERMAETLRERGVRTHQGIFGAHMFVESINDGPVTIWLDSRKAT